MILNIYGPSGSGKTTFIHELLRLNKMHEFYENFANEKSQENLNQKISISLFPIPLFRGTIEDYFNIFSINLNQLLELSTDLNQLSESIFEKLDNYKSLEILSNRNVETFSAGEMRRLFLLKSLLVESRIIVIDEPFSNSDEKLWNIIFASLKTKSRSIILSHLALEKLFETGEDYISFHINDIKGSFLI